MGVVVRAAQPEDAEQMSELLNEIIAVGGTTAFLDPVSPEVIRSWMARDADVSSWQVAVDEAGRVLGYQAAEVAARLPEDTRNMSSFVRVDAVGLGVGSKLFAATLEGMRGLGYTWLNASIRSDNDSGLKYYSKMGFEDYLVDPDAALSDGRVMGKTHKRLKIG
jgi:L-amino acid N-acyltransferase YncA